MQSIIRTSVALPNGTTIEVETGRLARQADGSVVLNVGDTLLLATVVSNKEARPDVDFLPLSVDFKEYYASTGKIPGGFFKRDGRLNEYEILTSRLVDRSLRPLFPEDYHAETQVIVTLMSSDRETQADALACVAASCAIMCSDLPFPDPVATVRMGYIDGQFVVNPSFSQMEVSDIDLMIAGTMDSIVMVEGEMNEVSEELMLEAFGIAHETIKQINQMQLDLRAQVGKTTREYPGDPSNEALEAEVREKASAEIYDIYSNPTAKQERSDRLKALRESLLAPYAEDPELDSKSKLIKRYFEQVQYEVLRKLIVEENKRLDGRRSDDIRPIWCEAGYLRRAHGSAIFTRGETQSLTTVTLGSKLDEQTIDYATQQGSKKFMLQYIFPPYSTGEVKMLRAPARREVGHGNLAERALKKVVPSDTEYTIRVVSEILESNGSSSMATVCAGSLALMDAGIQLRKPVSGIAMGLIVEGDRFAVLSDILGDEDHLGDMDFKVTGTEDGITACQMDIKVRGLSYEVLSQALAQAKAGRAHILSVMNQTLAQARHELSPYAPRIIKFSIPPDTIGGVIGPGGKVIQEIQRETQTSISIEEYDGLGWVSIASPNAENLKTAEAWIKGITSTPEVGTEYQAKVKNIVGAGAFLEFLPGKDGWLHISEISNERVETIEDHLEVGQIVDVKLIEVDSRTGKCRLSMKQVGQEGVVVSAPRGGGGDRRNGGDRRDDRRGGGGRDDRRGGGGRDDRRDRGPKRNY